MLQLILPSQNFNNGIPIRLSPCAPLTSTACELKSYQIINLPQATVSRRTTYYLPPCLTAWHTMNHDFPRQDKILELNLKFSQLYPAGLYLVSLATK